jgi:hypothetical protein
MIEGVVALASSFYEDSEILLDPCLSNVVFESPRAKRAVEAEIVFGELGCQAGRNCRVAAHRHIIETVECLRINRPLFDVLGLPERHG